MGTLLAIFIIYPWIFFTFVVVVLWMDWFKFINKLPAREKELAQASHGVGVIVCGWAVVRLSFHLAMIPQAYRVAICVIYAFLVCLGVFWLLIGSVRAQIFGDHRLLTRAVTKFAAGCAIFIAWQLFHTEVDPDYRWWLEPVVKLVYLWCWATGITKIIICSRPMPRLAANGTPEAYGAAKFRQGRGLQGQRVRPRYKR